MERGPGGQKSDKNVVIIRMALMFGFISGRRYFGLRNKHPVRRRPPHLVRLHRGRPVPVEGRSCR